MLYELCKFKYFASQFPQDGLLQWCTHSALETNDLKSRKHPLQAQLGATDLSGYCH